MTGRESLDQGGRPVGARDGVRLARELRERDVQEKQAEAERRQSKIEHRCQALGSVLADGLCRPSPVDFVALRRSFSPEPFLPGMLSEPEPQPRWWTYAPRTPGLWARIFGDAERRRQEREQAQQEYDRDVEAHRAQEMRRRARLEEAQRQHERAEVSREEVVRRHNEEVEQRQRAFAECEQSAVEGCLRSALSNAVLPSGVTTEVEVAYRPGSGQVLVVRELPGPDVIPPLAGYRFVKARMAVDEVPRKKEDARQRYLDLLAQLILLTVRDVFVSTTAKQVSEVVVNGLLTTTDPATGQPARPCLVSVSVTREQFDGLRLSDVTPRACLDRLEAVVSPNPYDVKPVRPLFEPDLSRFRLVDAPQVAAGLDSRTVLVDLHPTDFERLVRELFVKMGMQSWVTQASRDDGIDAVAVNPDRVVGGLAVIQAKRYRKVVPAEAVRALWGSMEDKKAGVGILVTTSYFGKWSHDFAYRNERVRLIEGPELKQLIAQHLGRDVIPGANEPPRGRRAPRAD